MKKIALILCLVLVASFVLSGCNNSDSIITLEDREVGKIEIQSGNIVLKKSFYGCSNYPECKFTL